MDPLLKASILRTLGFLLWASLSAWLFVIVEYTEKDDREEKYQLLYSLYQFLASKYNMSLEEFNNISNIAYGHWANLNHNGPMILRLVSSGKL